MLEAIALAGATAPAGTTAAAAPEAAAATAPAAIALQAAPTAAVPAASAPTVTPTAAAPAATAPAAVPGTHYSNNSRSSATIGSTCKLFASDKVKHTWGKGATHVGQGAGKSCSCTAAMCSGRHAQSIMHGCSCQPLGNAERHSIVMRACIQQPQ
jgi:hypothetical protein